MPSWPPFRKEDELWGTISFESRQDSDTLPGFPTIRLTDVNAVAKCLHDDLVPVQLEAAATRLWIMTTQSGANVRALHRQLLTGRNIKITEDPGMHLVWSHNNIFIKPLPRYLLSHTVWASTICGVSEGRQLIGQAALGLLRTYSYLIKHESDFTIAQRHDLGLLPSSLSWPEFSRYISSCRGILDTDVSSRYYYGELRQSRLNLYAPLLFNKMYYEKEHWDYSDYFATFFGPILFALAIISIILNGMQVALQVEQISSVQWAGLWSVSRWFAVLSVIGATAVGIILFLVWAWVILDEWTFACKDRWRKRHCHPKR